MSRLALAVALLAALSGCAHADNFLYFWGPGYCSTSSCTTSPPNNRFTIHGLWPNYGTGGYPQDCSGTQYSAAAISSITSQLNTAWPSFSGSNSAFWSHEYNKHGVCAVNAGVSTGELDYFKDTLALYNDYNLLSALTSAGITPSNTKTYSASSINNAVRAYFGFDALIKCSSGYLTEIWQCFDENLNIEDCNTACNGSPCDNDCSQTIKVPTTVASG